MLEVLEEIDPLFSSQDYRAIPNKTNSSNFMKIILLAYSYKIHFLLVLTSYFFSLINKNNTCILIKRFQFDSFLYTVSFYIVYFNFSTFENVIKM